MVKSEGSAAEEAAGADGEATSVEVEAEGEAEVIIDRAPLLVVGPEESS